jgi:allantoin racemase
LKILIINGNRTERVTQSVLSEAKRVASADVALHAVTAEFGADIVYSHAENTLAAHAVLDCLARHHEAFDAAILAISFDSGLAAARELIAIPVLGLTESALLRAAALGQRIGVITFGAVSNSLYDEVLWRSGLGDRLIARRTIEIGSTTHYLKPREFDAEVLRQANDLAHAGADVVVICGAAVAGIAARLQAQTNRPLVDGVAAAIQRAEELVRNGAQPPAISISQAKPLAQIVGVGPELAELFNRRAQ